VCILVSYVLKKCKLDEMTSGSYFENKYKSNEGVIRLLFCFVNDNQMTPSSGLYLKKNVNRIECHPIVMMVSQGYFSHFNMGILGIKFFYGGAGRRYGGGGRIRQDK